MLNGVGKQAPQSEDKTNAKHTHIHSERLEANKKPAKQTNAGRHKAGTVVDINPANAAVADDIGGSYGLLKSRQLVYVPTSIGGDSSDMRTESR